MQCLKNSRFSVTKKASTTNISEMMEDIWSITIDH